VVYIASTAEGEKMSRVLIVKLHLSENDVCFNATICDLYWNISNATIEGLVQDLGNICPEFINKDNHSKVANFDPREDEKNTRWINGENLETIKLTKDEENEFKGRMNGTIKPTKKDEPVSQPA
jgi:hypothetical protein